MTDENEDDSKSLGKWSAPTSSYDDAQAIKRLIKKAKSQSDKDSSNGSTPPE